jgi:hypothetical protein
MEMPEELQDRYGYPEITEVIKRNILGLNFARLMKIDVTSKLRELYPDIETDALTKAAGARGH